jgi:hypothetical protein
MRYFHGINKHFYSVKSCSCASNNKKKKYCYVSMATIVTSHCNVVPTFSVLLSFSPFDSRFFISGLVSIHCEVSEVITVLLIMTIIILSMRVRYYRSIVNCYYGNERQPVALSSVADENWTTWSFTLCQVNMSLHIWLFSWCQGLQITIIKYKTRLLKTHLNGRLYDNIMYYNIT